MTELFPYISLSVVSLGLVVICWKILNCLQQTTGQKFRSEDRKRRDLFQLLERSMERRDTPQHQKVDLVNAHRGERMSQVSSDAKTEQMATNSKKPVVPQVPKLYEPDNAVAEVAGAYQ